MRGFLIDLDGTMYAGNRPIEHAAAFIDKLKEEGSPYLFVTNNSSRRPEEVAAHLREVAGVEAAGRDVFTSAQAAARYIADRKPGARVHFIGEAGLEHALREAGLTVTERSPDFVVQGIDRAFDYAKLELAARLIREGAAYVLTNPDHLLPSDDGPKPGAGSIAAAITTAAQQEPIIIGKPSPIIMGYAVERLGLPASAIWAVGDNVRTDIGGGAAAGCRTALVLTGLATAGNALAHIAAAGVRPDLICADLLALHERLR
ncbi:HAD-IIA family hydrolase [Paenibacillus cymbidii]|uniref:HAD-IIA family hydrolase n=1 Tax=Paenibacillus cymbidii TaxID=1639034 RepID=UPI001082221D|nr:HAD-IIA family hydrolase [Paenibacillus cymbidii]